MYLSTFMSIALLEVFLLLLGLIFFLILHIRTLNKRLTQTKGQLQTAKSAQAERSPTERSPTERSPDEVTFDTLEPAEPPTAAPESTGDRTPGDRIPGDWNQLINEQLAITQQLRQQIDQEIPETEDARAKEPLDGHVDQLEDLIHQGKGAAEQLESQIESLKDKLSEVAAGDYPDTSEAPGPEADAFDMPDGPATTLLDAEAEELPDTIDMDTPLDELESFDIDSLETADIDQDKNDSPRRKADSGS